MRDPIDELRSFAVGLDSTPLQAAEVRHRGDRHRRRRQAANAIGAVAAIGLLVTGGLTAGGSLTTSTPVGPATQGATPSGTADPEQTDLREIPDAFPLSAGLPSPGGDIGPLTWSDDPTEPLSAVACADGAELAVDDRRIDSRRVELSAPDAAAWRHLVLFEDDAAAEQAFADLGSRGEACAESSPIDTGDGVSEVRWEVGERTHAGDEVLTLRGLTYAAGTDIRVPGRSVAEAVRVGRALLVARFDDASSTQGDDREMLLSETVDTLSDAMCVFTHDGCGPAPARVLGPDGLGDLRLGMTRTELEAAGAVVERVEMCSRLTAPGYRPSDSSDGYLSERHGLVAIYARPGVRTQEGIGIGSTTAEVAAAYPDAEDPGNGFLHVRVSPAATYSMAFVDGTVVTLSLQADVQDCFG